uniref:Uncharacterized protein n=1 Tax=Pelusios castaneus TaxID=367368 RepID=A0A8C8S2L0_9SAUR
MWIANHGADVSVVNKDSWSLLRLRTGLCFSFHSTALHVGDCFRYVSLVKLLASQGADLERKHKNPLIPLHFAMEKGKFRVVQYLLKSGPSVNCLDENYYGWMTLHLSCFKGHIEIICLFRESCSRLNVKGGMDWTSLHVATLYREESDTTRCTSLQMALRNQKQDIAIFLQGQDSPVNDVVSRMAGSGEKTLNHASQFPSNMVNRWGGFAK